MQNLIYYILLGLTVISNASGGLMMKSGSKNVLFGHGESLTKTVGSMITNWMLIGGIILYGFSFVFSTLVYTKLNLNIAYPIMVSLTFLLISLASLIFLGEKMTILQVVGYVLLISGVVLMSISAKENLG